MKAGQFFVLCGFLLLAVTVCGCLSPAGNAGSSPARNAPASGHSLETGEVGQYVFTDTLGNVDRPITVYTYRPAAWNTSGPILIALHGAGRSAAPSRNVWIPYADRYSCLVVAPEFSSQNYPGDQWYIGGNIQDMNGKFNPPANWTYTAIEHLFDDVRNRTGARTDTYLLFGHSAGGQFVHRLVTFLPGARYSRAVAANAGLYMMPTYSVAYGFGLKDSPLAQTDLPNVFTRKLIIMSGGSDTNPNDSGLANFPAAEAQGSTRFERARNYFTTARQEAARLNITLNWEHQIVPGVGHDESGMAGPSAVVLFNESS
jgi:pimeloyl-ACP methyl ester carboxylesterase